MQSVLLESTLLASVSYDGQRRLLDVVFRSGEIYRYFNIPSACYQRLLGGGLQRKLLQPQYPQLLPLSAFIPLVISRRTLRHES